MYTKADFTDAIASTIDNYPAIAALYRAGDPRILQNLEAQATMLAMLSSQLEVAMSEPFEKVRDATVLADASMRGIIRKARPGKVTIAVSNKGLSSFTLDSGRVILDSIGNNYRVDMQVKVAANDSAIITATQVKTEIITHIVSESIPFYAIEIPESNDGSYLSGIAVSDYIGDYEYRERYVNTLPNERVFHVEADDKQRIYVRFGQAQVVAFQPDQDAVITLTVSRSVGVISILAGSPFSFDYISSVASLQESLIDMSLHTVDPIIDTGENPPDMTTLRDIIKYPSVYDHNAVFLGEFEFLVRRAYPSLKFLSIWNESVEELARGASADNINVLFVACMSNDALNPEQFLSAPSVPVFILDTPAQSDLTPTQTGIKATIKAADDSYKVKFYTPIKSKIVMSVNATVSTAYISTEVVGQIKAVILAEYGIDAPASRRGSNKPLYQQIYALLRKKIPALSDANSDWTVSITPLSGTAYKPELWRYVDSTSLTVTVTPANVSVSGWG